MLNKFFRRDVNRKGNDTCFILLDFANAVEGLDLAGSNWVVFQNRFLIAIRQKKILGQFDGTNPKPSVLGEGATKTERKHS